MKVVCSRAVVLVLPPGLGLAGFRCDVDFDLGLQRIIALGLQQLRQVLREQARREVVIGARRKLLEGVRRLGVVAAGDQPLPREQPTKLLPVPALLFIPTLAVPPSRRLVACVRIGQVGTVVLALQLLHPELISPADGRHSDIARGRKPHLDVVAGEDLRLLLRPAYLLVAAVHLSPDVQAVFRRAQPYVAATCRGRVGDQRQRGWRSVDFLECPVHSSRRDRRDVGHLFVL